MKNILYIHGLDSFPKPERLEILNRQSQTHALHLDYQADTKSYQKLSDLIKSSSIDGIVGSSLGGLIGFWLSEAFTLPCLLFNPSLNAVIPPSYGIIQHYDNCPKRIIVLGQQDQVVNPWQTLDFLKDHPNDNCQQEILMNSKMGHEIPINYFKRYVDLFFNSYPS